MNLDVITGIYVGIAFIVLFIWWMYEMIFGIVNTSDEACTVTILVLVGSILWPVTAFVTLYCKIRWKDIL